MYFVNPEDVKKRFGLAMENYNGLISKEIAKEELENAIDNAEIEWIPREGDEE